MKTKIAAALLGVTAAVGTCLGVPAAHAETASPQVVGGTQAPSTAWAVQLEFGDGQNTYGCSGELISSEWVLTAQHCIDGTTWMNVYFSNSTYNRGAATAVDQVNGSPNGDVALVHLSRPRYSSSYARIADSYSPRYGDSAKLMGYGLRGNKTPSSGLFQANVTVVGSSSDAYGGSAIHVKGVNGASNHGDSGGPLLINGYIVGVCSTGDTADPGNDIHAGSNYANLTYSRDWIYDVAGV